MPIPTRRVSLPGALALSMGTAGAATAPRRVVAASIPRAETLDFAAETLASRLPLKIIEMPGDLRPNAPFRDGDADANVCESAEGNPYANVPVTAEGLARDPRVLRLASVLTSAEVAAFIRTRYRGSVIPVRPT